MESAAVLWFDGWHGPAHRRTLEAVVPYRGGLTRRSLPARDALLARAFEPGLLGLQRPGRTVSFQVDGLSTLPRLVRPEHVTKRLYPKLKCSRQAITAVPAREGTIYVPVMLWIRALWARTRKWADALLTPNGLDLVVLPAEQVGNDIMCRAAPGFVGVKPSSDRLRRIAWLACSREARESWGSVLSFAMSGVLDVRLPPVSARGWAWGIELDTGVLACELASVELGIELPAREVSVAAGTTVYRCLERSSGTPGMRRRLLIG